jgi:hypothetical protein
MRRYHAALEHGSLIQTRALGRARASRLRLLTVHNSHSYLQQDEPSIEYKIVVKKR